MKTIAKTTRASQMNSATSSEDQFSNEEEHEQDEVQFGSEEEHEVQN